MIINNVISSGFISTGITFLSAFFMLIINIFLVKILDVETFGKFSIIRNSIIFFPLLIHLGIGNSIIMMHRNRNIFEYNWKTLFDKSFFYSFFLCFPSFILFYYFFNFSILESGLIF